MDRFIQPLVQFPSCTVVKQRYENERRSYIVPQARRLGNIVAGETTRIAHLLLKRTNLSCSRAVGSTRHALPRGQCVFLYDAGPQTVSRGRGLLRNASLVNRKHLKATSSVLRYLPGGCECMSTDLSLPALRAAILNSPSFTIFFHLLQLWMETDDREIAPCLTNGWMALLHGLPTSKLPPLKGREGEDGNKSPPAAPITERAHLTEGLQSTLWAQDGKTQACDGECDDGVKGTTTSHSNQPSTLICYPT